MERPQLQIVPSREDQGGSADLDIARARSQLKSAGWPDEACAAASLDDAHKKRTTLVSDNARALIADPRIEVIVEATGVPGAGIEHALDAIANGKHVVMVNVEADAVAGPLLASRARAAGVVYSLAWGDQPASRSSAPAKGRVTSRTIINPIPTMSGTSSTSI